MDFFLKLPMILVIAKDMATTMLQTEENAILKDKKFNLIHTQS